MNRIIFPKLKDFNGDGIKFKEVLDESLSSFIKEKFKRKLISYNREKDFGSLKVKSSLINHVLEVDISVVYYNNGNYPFNFISPSHIRISRALDYITLEQVLLNFSSTILKVLNDRLLKNEFNLDKDIVTESFGTSKHINKEVRTMMELLKRFYSINELKFLNDPKSLAQKDFNLMKQTHNYLSNKSVDFKKTINRQKQFSKRSHFKGIRIIKMRNLDECVTFIKKGNFEEKFLLFISVKDQIIMYGIPDNENKFFEKFLRNILLTLVNGKNKFISLYNKRYDKTFDLDLNLGCDLMVSTLERICKDHMQKITLKKVF